LAHVEPNVWCAGESERNWTLIILITASVGGLLVFIVILTVFIQVCIQCRKARR